jgi:hypothetical protein
LSLFQTLEDYISVRESLEEIMLQNEPKILKDDPRITDIFVGNIPLPKGGKTGNSIVRCCQSEGCSNSDCSCKVDHVAGAACQPDCLFSETPVSCVDVRYLELAKAAIKKAEGEK